jgi:uncharacterized membrane protein
MEADAPLALGIRFEKSRAEQVGMAADILQALLRNYPRVSFGVCLGFVLGSEYFSHFKIYARNRR